MVMSRVLSQIWEFEVAKQCGHSPADSNKTTEARFLLGIRSMTSRLFEIG